mmetsp:Transcript_32343/g.50393  ORF Transcript_32343/g.50393 Transcript_32343/m.50393 type:complete len:83 (-) Transcript_32343:43-291(-)
MSQDPDPSFVAYPLWYFSPSALRQRVQASEQQLLLITCNQPASSQNASPLLPKTSGREIGQMRTVRGHQLERKFESSELLQG